jgi:hypothetical protein
MNRGTLRNTGNMMFMAALMGKYGNNKQAHICWARSQMRYITGTATGKSYLVSAQLLRLCLYYSCSCPEWCCTLCSVALSMKIALYHTQ